MCQQTHCLLYWQCPWLISLRFHLYRIHNLPLLNPNVHRSFHYELYLAGRSDMIWIAFPDGDNIMSCIVSMGHFCRPDTALYPVDKVKDFCYFLFMKKEKVHGYCKISLVNQKEGHVISRCYWAKTILIPKK